MYDNYKQNNRMVGKKFPVLIKGWVAKWQRAPVTPFRDATALEAVPFAPGIDFIYTKKRYDLDISYIHIKKETI